MADIPLVQLPYPEEETRTFELSTSLSPNWDKNGRIFYTDETGQVVRPQTKYNPLQMLGRRLKAFGSNAKNFVEDFNMDKSHTYFAPFEDINEQYKAGNIDKSELPYLAQGRAEQEIREAQQQERDNINRGWLGTGLSAASMLPIFNIPYVGTGLGGAMYDLGQGITEGNNADELWDRTKRGFAIGESVGAIPYVGKFAGKTKAGQAVGSALNKAGEKFANTKLYDALMTDVIPNSNKQPVYYHGTKAVFDDFSPDFIGTAHDEGIYGRGFYFTPHKSLAQSYANSARNGTNPRVIAANLEMKNPLIMENFNSAEDLAKYLDMEENIGDFVRSDYNGKTIFRPNGFLQKTGKFKGRVQDLGHDGVIVGNNEAVVYSPDQIHQINQPDLYEQLTGKQNTGALVDALFNR
jgi:hypothetical protein